METQRDYERFGFRRCQTCRTPKHLTEFVKSKKERLGIGYYCRICWNAKSKVYNQNNPEARNARIRKWRAKRTKKGYLGMLLRSARNRATKNNIPFSLTQDDIIVPEHCPVLGIRLIPGAQNGNSPSIDRIIPSRGYVPENIIVISRKANLIKSNATPEEIRRVADFFGK